MGALPFSQRQNRQWRGSCSPIPARAAAACRIGGEFGGFAKNGDDDLHAPRRRFGTTIHRRDARPWPASGRRRGARSGRSAAAEVRAGGVRGVSEMRPAQARVSVRALRGLSCREARRLQLQAAWLLPELRRAADGGKRGAPGRRSAAAKAPAPVGAIAALRATQRFIDRHAIRVGVSADMRSHIEDEP